MKKHFVFSFGQFSLIVIMVVIISVLSFLLGVEVGRLLKTAEKVNMPDLKPSVTISLQEYSSVITKKTDAAEASPMREEKAETVSKPIDEETKKLNEELKNTETLIQVGAYKEKSSYIATEKRLKDMGFELREREGKLKRLLIAVKGDREKAEEVLKRLEKEGIRGFIVKR